MIKTIEDRYKISDIYRRKIFSGYFSIILIFISLDLIPMLYGILNSNWVNTLTIITLIPAVLLAFYFFIGLLIMMPKNNKESQIRV